MRNVLGVVGLGLLTLSFSFSALEKVEAQVWEVGGQRLELPVPQDGANFGRAVAIGDFNGDGRRDLAVGAPFYDVPGIADCGLVSYYLGAAGGGLEFRTSGSWNDGDSQFLGVALAAGDFNGDGRDELAAGRPRDDVVAGVTYQSAGTVLVLGWDSDLNQPKIDETLVQLQAAPTFANPEANDYFGAALAVGNFDGDAYDDLAVGVPGEDWAGQPDVGIVHIYYGSSDGLSGVPTSLLSASRTSAEQFGLALAAGDFRRAGWDDLAVGVPYRQVSGAPSAGAVEVYQGSAGGVLSNAPQILTDAALGKAAQEDEHFGFALAAGDFDRTASSPCLIEGLCNEDLAIGVPGQQVDESVGAGKVEVLYGRDNGLSTVGPTTLYQDNVGEIVEEWDQFGASLAASSFDPEGDKPSNLAVGAPHEDTGPGLIDDGIVHLVFGSPSGINAGLPAQLVEQRPGFGIAPPESGDLWGYALALRDLDGDGWEDLFASAHWKDIGPVISSGAVQVLYGALFADGFERGNDTGW